MLPGELHTGQETAEVQQLLQMCPLVSHRQVGRCKSLQEWGVGNAGRCKHPSQPHRSAHPLVCHIFQLCKGFIISKRQFSAVHTTSWSWHRTGQRNLNNSQEERFFHPHIPCQPKHTLPGDCVRPKVASHSEASTEHCTFWASTWSHPWKRSNAQAIAF